MKTFSKVGAHRLRMALTADYGAIGPVTKTVTLSPTDHLYPYV